MCKIEYAWPSRALSHDDIKLSAAAFRPGRLFRLSRHRDPAPVGVCHTVPVESSLLHCSGIDELSKEGTFCFRPALVNNSGSIRTIRFFRADVNYFRDVIRRPHPLPAGRSGVGRDAIGTIIGNADRDVDQFIRQRIQSPGAMTCLTLSHKRFSVAG